MGLVEHATVVSTTLVRRRTLEEGQIIEPTRNYFFGEIAQHLTSLRVPFW